MANLDAADAVLTLTAFDKTGRLLAGPGIRNPITMPLRAGAQTAQMDFQVFGDSVGLEDASDFFVNPGPDIREGHVKIAGNGVRLAGNVVFGDAEGQTSATSLPLVSRLQSEMIFSHLISDASYYTGVALLNPGSTDTASTVEVHDSDGRLLATYPATVPAGRSATFVLSTLPGLQAVNLGSGYVRVTASQPIAGFALFGTHNNSVVSAIPSSPIW